MTEQALPTVGGEYVFEGCNVRVKAVKKRGRGYQVHFCPIVGDGTFTSVRLKDWRKGVQ